jgi:hypothetical protein
MIELHVEDEVNTRRGMCIGNEEISASYVDAM